jgi:hypothetical protein
MVPIFEENYLDSTGNGRIVFMSSHGNLVSPSTLTHNCVGTELKKTYEALNLIYFLIYKLVSGQRLGGFRGLSLRANWIIYITHH